MPGIALVIEGAMQHAPHPSRQAWAEEDCKGMAIEKGQPAKPSLSHARAGCDVITQRRFACAR